MANEKEPSIYYDRSTIGSSGELDEYGVWVKSEPRDLSDLSLPDSDPGVEEEALPIEDFSIEEEYSAGDLAENSVEDLTEDSDEAEEGFTGIFFEDFPEDTVDSVDIADTTGSPEPQSTAELVAEAASRSSAQEFSTQLLMKIADELASIRAELSTLKKEFSAIRPGGSFEEAHGEDKDENIALTGNEIDNILNTMDVAKEGDFTEEIEEKIPMETVSEDFTLDDADISPGAVPDNAALDEAALDNAALDEAALGNVALDEAILDNVALDEAILDNVALDEAILDNVALDEAVPDNVALDEPALDNVVLDEPALDEAALTNKPLEETGQPEEDSPAAPEEAELENISLDDLSFDDDIFDEPDLGAAIDESSEDAPEASAEKAADDFTTLSIEETPDTGSDEDLGDAVTEAAADDVPEAEEELELSIPEDTLENTVITEESFARIIPEGFITDKEDTPVPEDDGFEAALVDDGLEEAAGEVVPEETPGDAGVPDEVPHDTADIPDPFKRELKKVLSYMDQLLESLPENKIEEFAKSEYFDTYKKVFKELGLI
ncbi:hypothetical protein FACS189491_10620 [Spirochaetia bacterium]|nr:hypothetical protein FACS189491_10620 [Spirochaetia bacterium]